MSVRRLLAAAAAASPLNGPPIKRAALPIKEPPQMTDERLIKLLAVGLPLIFLAAWFTVGLLISIWPYLLIAAAMFVLVMICIAKAHQ